MAAFDPRLWDDARDVPGPTFRLKLAEWKVEAPACPYCGEPARLALTSRAFYRGTDYGPVWCCIPCDAWVGCHKNGCGYKAKGLPANAHTRELRIQAHAVFDPMWQRKIERDKCTQHTARGVAYAWLAEQLRIDVTACHISQLPDVDLLRIIAICTPYAQRIAARKAQENRHEQ